MEAHPQLLVCHVRSGAFSSINGGYGGNQLCAPLMDGYCYISGLLMMACRRLLRPQRKTKKVPTRLPDRIMSRTESCHLRSLHETETPFEPGVKSAHSKKHRRNRGT